MSPSIAVDIADMGEWKDLVVYNEIIKALAEKGFNSPTTIKILTLPAHLSGNMYIIGAAETGSGKTLASLSFRASWGTGGMRRLMQSRWGMRKELGRNSSERSL